MYRRFRFHSKIPRETQRIRIGFDLIIDNGCEVPAVVPLGFGVAFVEYKLAVFPEKGGAPFHQLKDELIGDIQVLYG
jgi:hypothetical protein